MPLDPNWSQLGPNLIPTWAQIDLELEFSAFVVVVLLVGVLLSTQPPWSHVAPSSFSLVVVVVLLFGVFLASRVVNAVMLEEATIPM